MSKAEPQSARATTVAHGALARDVRRLQRARRHRALFGAAMAVIVGGVLFQIISSFGVENWGGPETQPWVNALFLLFLLAFGAMAVVVLVSAGRAHSRLKRLREQLENGSISD